MIETSVSNLDLFQIWASDDDLDVQWLVNKITGPREQTPAMAAGEAFHKAIENAQTEGEYEKLSAMGYTFRFCGEFDIALPQLKEVKVSAEYSGVLVKGRVDGLGASVVHELKTTEQFDPDRYLDRLQWRFYLDLTGANQNIWHIFQMKQSGYEDEKQYDVYGYHQLSEYRYPELHKDCLKAAEEYKQFAERFLVTGGQQGLTEGNANALKKDSVGAAPQILS
jgi:hypothetical protein